MDRKPVTLTIVDSNVLIDAIRRREPALAFLERVADEGLVWSSVLVRSELLVGIRSGEDRRVADLFDRISWQDVTSEIADLAGRLGAPFRRSHQLDMVDLGVAATTMHLSGDLATLNTRHFPMFPGLQPPY